MVELWLGKSGLRRVFRLKDLNDDVMFRFNMNIVFSFLNRYSIMEFCMSK